jgi:Spy/CpxP family protein refolding chaperone
MTTTSTTRAVVLLGAAFLLGLVAGGAGMMLADKSGKRPGRRPECAVHHQRVCMWAEELQLTTDQQERLLNVYRQGEARMDSIQKTIRPAMDSLYQRIRPEVDSQRHVIRELVRPLLTPEQREKYDSVITSMDEQRRQGRDRPNGTPGGPGAPGGPSRGRP